MNPAPRKRDSFARIYTDEAKRKGASLPVKLAVTAGFSILAYGGIKLATESSRAKQPLSIVGQAAGFFFFAYGFYYAASLGLLLALQAVAPDRRSA